MSAGVVEKGCLGSGCVLGQEYFEKRHWINALKLCSHYQAGQDAMGFESALRPCAKADFPEDNHATNCLFCMIIGGWHV